MYKKTAGLLAAGILSMTSSVAAPAAGAADDFPPPGCLTALYGVFLGQGVQMTCYSLPDPSRMYQVVAHCQSGSSYWYTAGNLVPLGFGPSTAECNGGLLWSAHVAGFHVVDF
ncbi:hypothetical protein [Amycolatopsis sp. NPDC059657]|uniref:hypothetical protein n=1 Tax=Amycolatopsis sp. NPDC059657 TaxID=3346899 RepID=UPI00366D154E